MTTETWPEPMSLVEIHWVDSQYHGNGWLTRDQVEVLVTNSLLCRSVGWLYRDAGDRLMLIQNISATEEVGCLITIPKDSVLYIRWIESPQTGRSDARGIGKTG